jgi:hypothetical protein
VGLEDDRFFFLFGTKQSKWNTKQQNQSKTNNVSLNLFHFSFPPFFIILSHIEVDNI